MFNNFVLDVLSFVILLLGFLVITSQNPVLSMIYLIGVFLFTSGYLILIDITFIGLSYLIVYIGAIAILFLFVIMIMNVQINDINTLGFEFTKNLPLGFILSLGFLIEILSFMPLINYNNFMINIFNYLNNLVIFKNNNFNINLDNSNNMNFIFNKFSDVTFNNYSQIETLGFELYMRSSLELILTSLILLLAMLAPILLCVDRTHLHR